MLLFCEVVLDGTSDFSLNSSMGGSEIAWHTFTGWNSLPTDMVSDGVSPCSALASSDSVRKDVSVVPPLVCCCDCVEDAEVV